MPSSQSSSNASDSSSDCSNETRIALTASAINWDVLAALACKIFKADTFSWGKQLGGGYNVARFLKLDDVNKTEIVARVPYKLEGDVAAYRAADLGRRISSEVAVMEYLSLHTRIPVPRVIAHNVEEDGGGVGSPFIMMTKADGIPLCWVWDDMEDAKREIILEQVVDILLQLSSIRFEKIGALFKDDSGSKPEFYIAPFSTSPINHVEEPAHTQLYSSALDYWKAYSTYTLEYVDGKCFGSPSKPYDYAITWFLRSLIPALYDTSLDSKGFPLVPDDFHSQNIFITGHDTPSPKISAVIDWECTKAGSTRSFAQYPMFIMDDPAWEVDHPVKPRNPRDQATFLRLMHEAESKLCPEGHNVLSRAYESCSLVYLFEQCITNETMFPILQGELVRTVLGAGEDTSITTEFPQALLKGILKTEKERFDRETVMVEEAMEVLGRDIISYELTRSGFIDIVEEHLDKFEVDSEIRKWLLTCD